MTERDEAELAGLPTDALELELCSLSARVAAATCRFLAAVAEYDRRRAWERWECHDMAGWLSWKCGISPVTAREQVRVARALEMLPLVRERFAAGRLSYSQTRAIARVATPDSESSLIEMASVSTAAQLEAITRGYRRCSQAADAAERRRDVARGLRWGWDDDGNLVGHLSLPAVQGAVLIKAIQEAVDRAAIDDADRDGAADPIGAARADALVELVTAGAHSRQVDGAATERDDDCFLVTVIAEASVLAGEGDPSEPGLCQVEDGPGLSAETARRIACDATVVTITEGGDGQILDVGRRTRRPNRALRRALHRRDGHCVFPGCSRRRVQSHHIVHWTKGGPTRLDNLVCLCSRHHHRLHEGGYRIEVDSGGAFRFYHPAGWLIPAVPEPAVLSSEDLDWAGYLGDIGPYEAGWDGSRLDLPLAVDCVLQADGRLVPRSADSAESATPQPVWPLTKDLPAQVRASAATVT